MIIMAVLNKLLDNHLFLLKINRPKPAWSLTKTTRCLAQLHEGTPPAASTANQKGPKGGAHMELFADHLIWFAGQRLWAAQQAWNKHTKPPSKWRDK